jgi:hypothetical protein
MPVITIAAHAPQSTPLFSFSGSDIDTRTLSAEGSLRQSSIPHESRTTMLRL